VKGDVTRIESLLAVLKAELAEQQAQGSYLKKQAHKSAGIKLALGFLGCFG